MNKRIETPHFAASCHAAYFARYIAMAAAERELAKPEGRT